MNSLFVILLVAVAGVVECKPGMKNFNRDLDHIWDNAGPNGAGLPIGWIAFLQLAGKCETARMLGYNAYGGDAYTVLGHECPRVLMVYQYIDNGGDMGELTQKLDEIFPLLECAILEAELESIEWAQHVNPGVSASEYLDGANGFLTDYCYSNFGDIEDEVNTIDQALEDVETGNPLRTIEADLRRLLSIASKKARK